MLKGDQMEIRELLAKKYKGRSDEFIDGVCEGLELANLIVR